MGIFGAMTTAITGLRAQSYALENISNNIANSQTTGYKRTDTSFADFVPDSPSRQQALGVVNAFSRPTNTIQGDIANSGVNTFMAINGDGYFVVGSRSGVSDGLPVFGQEDLYTRRGDFELDRNGYLVNAAGYYLKGLTIDDKTGNPQGGLPDVIRVTNDFLAASGTTEVDYRANLASYPLTTNANKNVANSELLNVGSYAVDPTVAGTGLVRATDASTFIEQSIAGGAITAYDGAGAPVNVQLRWAKIDSVANGGADTWNMFFLADSKATGTDTAWQNVGQNYIFGTDGQLSPAINSVTVSSMTIDGNNLGNIKIDHGVGGVTQFADPNGIAKTTQIGQDGYSAGEIVSISVSEAGRIAATYTNGRTVDVAEVTLASFNADGYLAKTDGGSFRATPSSGAAILGGLGRVVGSSLESSNTDIADEFSKLIVTQQAYAANTRIVSTGDEMMQETLNMIR